MNSRDIIKKLKQDGFEHTHTKGDHWKFKKNDRIVIVPHPKKDLPNRHCQKHVLASRVGVEVNMKYSVLVHKEDDPEYGVTIPDIPGCFTLGETIEQAIQKVQEAVELYYEGEDLDAPPEASNIDDLMKDSDLYTEGGFWVLADIDFSFISNETVRVNITVPKYKLAAIDRKAARSRKSRSAFLIEAAEAF